MNSQFQDRLRQRLEATGHYKVIAGEEIVWRPDVARREGQCLLAALLHSPRSSSSRRPK
jgi:hypothetical protein